MNGWERVGRTVGVDALLLGGLNSPPLVLFHTSSVIGAVQHDRLTHVNFACN